VSEQPGTRNIDVPSADGGTVLSMSAIGAESMAVVAFKDDRMGGDLFRRWLAEPGVMEQFTAWARDHREKT
jgi:hypothetical protein